MSAIPVIASLINSVPVTANESQAVQIPIWTAILSPLLTAGTVIGLMLWILNKNVFKPLEAAEAANKKNAEDIVLLKEHNLRDEGDQKLAAQSMTHLSQQLDSINSKLSKMDTSEQVTDRLNRLQQIFTTEHQTFMQLLQKFEKSHDAVISRIESITQDKLQMRMEIETLKERLKQWESHGRPPQ